MAGDDGSTPMMTFAIALAALLTPDRRSYTDATSKVPPWFNAGPPEDYPFPVIALLPQKAGESDSPTALYAGPIPVDGRMIGGSMVDLTTSQPELVKEFGAALAARHFVCTIKRVVRVEPLAAMGEPYWWVKCSNRHHYAIEETARGQRQIVRED
jgi:hypothetical protein